MLKQLSFYIISGEALSWVLENRGIRAFISGEQENKGLQMRVTGEQMQFWGTENIRILTLRNRGTKWFISREQGRGGHNDCVHVSQGRKKHMARPGLELRTSRIPCEHSDHWATEPHGRPVKISPCLIRLVPESAWNHAGTDETVTLLLAARARTHTVPPTIVGEELSLGHILGPSVS